MPRKRPPSPASLTYVEEFNQGAVGRGQPRKIEIRDNYSWLRLSPELVGICTAVVDDIVGEGFDLVTESKQLKKKVERWCRGVHFKSKLYTFALDMVVTGDGFLGKSKITKDQLKLTISDVGDMYKLEQNDDFYKSALGAILKQNPDLFEPRQIFNIKSSTIRIDYDVHGEVNGYYQGGLLPGSGIVIDSGTNINGPTYEANQTTMTPSEPIRFSTDEIIHVSLFNVGDSLYGFTPFTASLNDVASLWYAKDYAGKYFQEDATPNFMFLLKNETPNSPTYKEFISKLTGLKGKRYKNMVFTGEVDVQRVNPMSKDMEFVNLIQIFTQRLLMAWSMPPSRVSTTSGNYKGFVEATDGYYKKISMIQERIEEALNDQLFSEFGDIEMAFKRAYKRDESREADIINKLVGKPVLTVNEGREYLGKLPNADPALDELGAPATGIGLNPTGNQNPQQKNPDEKQNAPATMDTAQKGEDLIIPVDERISSLTEEIRSLKKFEVKLVDLISFTAIVEHTGHQLSNANIQYTETPDSLMLRFNDGLSEYKTIVTSASSNLEDFKRDNLRSAIRLLGVERPSVANNGQA